MKNWYLESEHPWGKEASGIVKKALPFLKSDKICDLGGGDGRNAIYLAKNSFEVTVVDKYRNALDILTDFAKEEQVSDSVHAQEADLENFDLNPSQNYLCCYILHFLPKQAVYSLVEQIKHKTEIGGCVVISDFIKDGNFYLTQTEGYFFEKGEILSLFDGWEIVDYSENVTPTKGFDKKDVVYTQGVANLIARKVS